jgi:hypothetical protein
MNIIITIFKWLLGIAMALSVVIGLIFLFSTESVPHDNLVKKEVTISRVSSSNVNYNIMTAVEYPNGFFVVPVKSKPEVNAPDININAGDKIDIGIKESDVARLNSKQTGIPVWSISNIDGKPLMDMKAYTDNIQEMMDYLKRLGGIMIGIPLIYFAAMIALRFRKKSAAPSLP